MEHSTFQGKLIPLETDAAAMKVHSKEKPPDIEMRLTKVFLLGKDADVQQKAVFQVIIADGCLFYGNDALRSRGGCCICLLMASGIIAKRFSMWVADASEGEITHTTFSERLNLAVVIILPRLVYTSHPCGQSNMDDVHGGHQKTTTRDVLTFAVRYLSRIHSDKTNGQEECWTDGPSDWPEHLLGPWKNPSFPRDTIDLLWKKYKYLRSQVKNDKLNQEELEAFEDFKPGKTESMKSFMRYKTLADKINKIKDQLADMQKPHLMLLIENLKQATGQISSFLSSSIATTSKGPTAADASSLLTLKRKSSSFNSVQGKKSKIEMPNCYNYIPTPTQTASSESHPVFAQNRDTPTSTAVESSLGYTAYANQSPVSVVSSRNTLSYRSIDSSKCTTSSYSAEASAATNVQSAIVTNPIAMYPLPDTRHEEPPTTVSHFIPSSSLDKVKEPSIALDQQKLNDKNVQDNLQFIYKIVKTILTPEY